MTTLTKAEPRERPLYVSIEIVANLVYLAKESEGNPEQQRNYLDRAAGVLFELREHPQLSHA
jgi:hypothetical protein